MRLILRHPQFRLFWVAGACSDVSLVTYFTVHGWLTLLITDSPFWVGVVAGVGGMAMTVFAPWGGVLIDRFHKIDVVRAASAIRAVAAALIAALIFTDSIQLWHVLLLPIAGGITGAVRVPGMMTLGMDLVGRENLLAATAARFTSMTLIGVVVPLSVGPMVDSVGIEWAYVAVAAGDVLSIGLLSFIDAPRTSSTVEDRRSPLQDLKSGLSYALRTPLVRVILGIILVNELFGWSLEPMLPVIARDVLGAGASGLGMLLAAISAGATASTLVLSAFEDVEHKGRLMVGGIIGFGCSLLVFSMSRSLPLSLAALALAGASVGLWETAADTVIQAGVVNRMRGRVLSLQAMMWGITGMTGFHTGAIAALIGPMFLVGIGGAVLVATGVGLTRLTRFLAESTSPDAAARSAPNAEKRPGG